ncbi:MAG: hypothetical protein Q8P67_00025 [archaeon]|nr:hypothetical protein [archaeon]
MLVQGALAGYSAREIEAQLSTTPLSKGKARPGLPAAAEEDGSFTKAARRVLGAIREIRLFLEGARAGYIVAAAEDAGAREIDLQVTASFREFRGAVGALQQRAAAGGGREEREGEGQEGGRRAHRTGVVQVVQTHYERAADYYARLRSVRVQELLRKSMFASLASLNPATNSGGRLMRDGPIQASSRAANQQFEEADDADEDMKLTAEEMQEFEQENQTLHRELVCLLDQVKEIEKLVLELAGIHSTIATHILDQAETVKHVHEGVVRVQANVQSANEQLRLASHQGVDSRMLVLVLMITLAFSLLYLNTF